MLNKIIQFFKDLLSMDIRPKIETGKELDQHSEGIPSYSSKEVIKYVNGTLPYMDYLIARVGNKEIPGKDKNNPVIVQFFIDVVGKAYPDETAHCMAAVQAALKNTGHKWIKSLWAKDAEDRASEFLVKKDLRDIAIGDVATKFSQAANSGRHVFLVLAVDHVNKQVLALESNASNMVKNTNWYKFDILRFCGTPIKK